MSDYSSKLNSMYNSLPSLDCRDCWGDCCVSPTMTAPEFALMMQEAQKLFNASELVAFLKKPLVEHQIYTGNQYCRFQDLQNGRCQVYPGRAMACRLHGHEALRKFETEDMEFCAREPGNRHALGDKAFQDILAGVEAVNSDNNVFYCEPYFLFSLNLDCWLDFFMHPEYAENRPTLQPLQLFLQRELPELFKLLQQNQFPPHTTLGGQLKTIDLMFDAISINRIDLVEERIHSLLYDFPSTGTYYLIEAKQILELFQKQMEVDQGEQSQGSR